MNEDPRMWPVLSPGGPPPPPWEATIIYALGWVAFAFGLLWAVVSGFAMMGGRGFVQLLAAGPFAIGIGLSLGGLLLMGFGKIVMLLAEMTSILRRIG